MSLGIREVVSLTASGYYLFHMMLVFKASSGMSPS